MASKYDALRDHLNAVGPEPLTLSLTTIDRLVGGLPPSARRHPAFWANTRTSHPHARAWLNAGRTVTRIDLNVGSLEFSARSSRPGPPPTGPSTPDPVGRPGVNYGYTIWESPTDGRPDRTAASDALDRLDWGAIWLALAETIGKHLEAGRGHLLTEDSFRFALITALELGGIPADEIRLEVIDKGIGGKLDLVIGDPAEAVVELKFPRDSKSTSPDTMTLGELLRDFYRLARVDAQHRWAVQLISDRLRRFLERRTDVRWTFVEGSTFAIPAGTFERLPLTAQRSLPAWTHNMSVESECEAAIPLTGGTLAVYRLRTCQPRL